MNSKLAMVKLHAFILFIFFGERGKGNVPSVRRMNPPPPPGSVPLSQAEQNDITNHLPGPGYATQGPMKGKISLSDWEVLGKGGSFGDGVHVQGKVSLSLSP